MVQRDARIVVFGASGYTGRKVVEALVAAGREPLLAGRNPAALAAVAGRCGGLATATAGADSPAELRALLEPGDVLVTTVGPFGRLGQAAIEAAVTAGAHYVDSTGEIAFVRDVWDRWGPQAEAGGGVLLTAFGYDFVPGNLAGAMALEEAGDAATRVDVGYFFTGRGRPSSGTAASLLLASSQPAVAWRSGRLEEVPAMAEVRGFDVDGRRLVAGSVGGSEHLALPRSYPRLADVGVYLGWFGRAVHVMAATAPLTRRVPAALQDRALALAMRRSGTGPSDDQLAGVGSRAIAVASDRTGAPLASVRVEGPDAYTLTGRLMAWAAGELLAGSGPAPGAHGPVDAWGLERLTAACADAGLARTATP